MSHDTRENERPGICDNCEIFGDCGCDPCDCMNDAAETAGEAAMEARRDER